MKEMERTEVAGEGEGAEKSEGISLVQVRCSSPALLVTFERFKEVPLWGAGSC